MDIGADGLTDLDYEFAFRDPEKAKQEIQRIVQELEDFGITYRAAQEASAKAEAARKERQAQLAQREVDRRAFDVADEWLKRQLAQGANEEHAQEAIAAAKKLRLLKRAWEVEDANRRKRIEELQAERAAAAAHAERAPPSIFRQPLPPPAQPPTPLDDPICPPAEAKPLPEFYRVLGLQTDATFDEVKKAYRKEALRWHPDKNRKNPEEAAERFKKITEAFDTLFDPERRAKYDEGEEVVQKKVKKLAGHGWNQLKDDDDAALTPKGFVWKRQSWIGYVMYRGRIDDVDPIVDDVVNDPRVPQEKLKVFWRHLGEKAHDARDEASSDKKWLQKFIALVWKDTPDKWPGGAELKNMSETSQAEWKERRMVYNRRKEKILLSIQLHEAYLAIPNREQKERDRIASQKIHVGELPRPDGGGDPYSAMVIQKM
eukprot:TRINITY_DN47576_c0_g1_i1.p1 TRINITY_DN47576_c0_g1~~TRINITY_DN47576_c0_g1_i1.p1  ORF type:complete len:430 (-),score=85.50 TRINITY_DN47576_c0_g1_i1:66-1355(-)